MGNTNNNNNNSNRRVVSKNTHSLWQRRRRAANLPPFSHSTISFRMYPHKRKILVRGTKTIQFSLHWQKCNIHLYMQCTCVNIFLGLLTHVPFPSFWSASLFSIFRHCDRQTFLLQTLLLLFMVLCANWENKRIRGSAIQFAFVDFLHIHCLGGNGNVTLICCCYFSGLVVLVLWFALLYSHSRSSF